VKFNDSPTARKYRRCRKIGSFDAYVFVTPEYNHGTSGALKNAIDFLFAEWNNRAAGFVSYGGAGGARAVEQLRLVLAEVQITIVRNQVLLSLFTDFENFSVFKPGSQQTTSVDAMLDQLLAWGGALKTLRKTSALYLGDPTLKALAHKRGKTPAKWSFGGISIVATLRFPSQ
jgi:NAD(P)H-dependent FMN reductase